MEYFSKENNIFMRIWKISWIETKSIIFSSRWAAITILSFLLMLFYTQGIRQFVTDIDLYVSPVVLPFLFSDYKYANMAMLIVVFLMSAFPIQDEMQKHIRLKGGNTAYALAQLVAIFSTVLCWIVQMQLLTLLVFNTRCLFGGWGKVWGSILSGRASDLGYSIVASISMNIVLYAEPYQALLVSALVIFLTAVVFAEVIYAVDSLTGMHIGELILLSWSFICIILSDFNLPAINKIMMTINPASWLNINDYFRDTANLAEIILKMLALVIVGGILNFIIIKKKPVI